MFGLIFWIFLVIIGLAIGIMSFLMVESFDKKNSPVLHLVVFFLILAAIIMGIYVDDNAKNYYKQGQIDSYNGNMRYQLIVNPDSTRTWELKK